MSNSQNEFLLHLAFLHPILKCFITDFATLIHQEVNEGDNNRDGQA